jgi:acyl carrier protein
MEGSDVDAGAAVATEDEIREKVVRALGRSLALAPETIQDDARLVDELGMDSLDFLDLTFALESQMALKLRDAEFDQLLRPAKAAASMGEFLTDAEVLRLAPFVPALASAAQGRPIPRADVYRFLTVRSLVRMVARRLLPSG